jgi:Transmembrane secretion effector
LPNRASTGEVWPLVEHTQILTLGLHTTFASLRHSNFRIYFTAQIGSNIGSWVQITAENWLVLQLAHSGLALGITNSLQFGPLLAFGLYGGVIADRFDRRRLQYWDPRRRPDRRTISCDIGNTVGVSETFLIIAAICAGTAGRFGWRCFWGFGAGAVGAHCNTSPRGGAKRPRLGRHRPNLNRCLSDQRRTVTQLEPAGGPSVGRRRTPPGSPRGPDGQTILPLSLSSSPCITSIAVTL